MAITSPLSSSHSPPPPWTGYAVRRASTSSLPLSRNFRIFLVPTLSTVKERGSHGAFTLSTNNPQPPPRDRQRRHNRERNYFHDDNGLPLHAFDGSRARVVPTNFVKTLAAKSKQNHKSSLKKSDEVESASVDQASSFQHFKLGFFFDRSGLIAWNYLTSQSHAILAGKHDVVLQKQEC